MRAKNDILSFLFYDVYLRYMLYVHTYSLSRTQHNFHYSLDKDIEHRMAICSKFACFSKPMMI
jgi:hypothetical protein